MTPTNESGIDKFRFLSTKFVVFVWESNRQRNLSLGMIFISFKINTFIFLEEKLGFLDSRFVVRFRWYSTVDTAWYWLGQSFFFCGYDRYVPLFVPKSLHHKIHIAHCQLFLGRWDTCYQITRVPPISWTHSMAWTVAEGGNSSTHPKWDLGFQVYPVPINHKGVHCTS